MLYVLRWLFRWQDDDEPQKIKDHGDGLHSLMITFTKDYEINNESPYEQKNSTALIKFRDILAVLRAC